MCQVARRAPLAPDSSYPASFLLRTAGRADQQLTQPSRLLLRSVSILQELNAVGITIPIPNLCADAEGRTGIGGSKFDFDNRADSQFQASEHGHPALAYLAASRFNHFGSERLRPRDDSDWHIDLEALPSSYRLGCDHSGAESVHGAIIRAHGIFPEITTGLDRYS